jgi:hypothetical protein
MKNLIGTIKIKLVCLFCLLLLFSCAERMAGPNYNSGQSHNSTMFGRTHVVGREDLRMKGAMTTARKKALKALPKAKKVRKKKGRKYIN